MIRYDLFNSNESKVNQIGYYPKDTHQWLKLLTGDQFELGDKIIEVFIASVHMRLGADGDQSIEVVNVHVHEHSEQTSQDLLAN